MKQGFSSKKLLTRNLLLLFCFSAFPLFLLHISLTSYYSLVHQQHLSEIFYKNRKALLKLSEYADGARFFELLLSKQLDKIEPGRQQTATLKKRLAKLKSSFPKTFEFVVWNQKGKLNKELTDKPDYIFFLNRLDAFLKNLHEITSNCFPGKINIPPEIDRQIRGFRQFLGPFIPAGKIAASFIPTQKRKCFEMHGKGPRAYGWYTTCEGYSILVFIEEKAAASLIGAQRICKTFNRHSREAKMFILNELSESIFPKTRKTHYNSLKLNLTKMKKLVPSESLQSDDSIFSFQNLKPGIWGAIVYSKNELQKYKSLPEIVLFRVIAIILIFFALAASFFLTHENPFSSIRFKLIFVFTYTVAVPVMIFATLGFDYVSQKIRQTEIEYGSLLMQSLNNFDREFANYNNQMAGKVNDRINRFLIANKKQGFSQIDWNDLARTLKADCFANAILIFDAEGNDLLERDYSSAFLDKTFPKSLATDLLEFLNDRKLDQIKQVKIMTEPSIQSFKKTRNKVNLLTMAEKQFFFFNSDIHLNSSMKAEVCIQIFWELRNMQSIFFQELNKRMKKSFIKPILYFNENGAVFPPEEISPELVSFLQKVEIQGAQYERLQSSKADIFAAGFSGPNLVNSVMAAVIDYKVVSQTKKDLRNSILVILLIILFFSFALYILLSQQILNPVGKLVIGVEKVKQLDYHHKIDLLSENEFGALAKSVNHTLESLAELEIAKVVQEALLPEETLKTGNFEVYGATQPMHKLGGDYFDYFVKDENVLHVFLADAAGHGVQAALMMAMAKSALLLESASACSSADIMHSLNRTFYQLRQSTIKTMLTGQLLRFIKDKGFLINAGHCYPVVLGPNGQTLHEVEQGSYPLGYLLKRKFNESEFDFKPGSTIVLFTDGLIESLNSRNEPLGTEGFFQILRDSYDHKLEKFYANIISRVKTWQCRQEDDLTIVLIRNNNADIQ